MTAQQVLLQRGQVGVRDMHPTELAEAGIDAVDDLAARNDVLDHGARRLQTPPGLGTQRHGRATAGDGHHVRHPQRLSIEDHARLHGQPFLYQLSAVS